MNTYINTNEEFYSSARETLDSTNSEYVFSIQEINEMIDEAYEMEIDEEWKKNLTFNSFDMIFNSQQNSLRKIKNENWEVQPGQTGLTLKELVWLIQVIAEIRGEGCRLNKQQLFRTLMSLVYHLDEDKKKVYRFTITRQDLFYC